MRFLDDPHLKKKGEVTYFFFFRLFSDVLPDLFGAFSSNYSS